MKKTIILFTGLAFLTFKNQAQTVTDYDGNVYNTVIIGTQVWLKENLKVTHYSNGTAIPDVTGNTAWSNLTTGAYCNYNNIIDSAIIYGNLYNWYTTVDSNNLCPTGWHIPSDAEWTTLTTYLVSASVAGGKMKETGITHWNSPNTGATNQSNFTGLPGGWRSNNGGFSSIREGGYLWSTTEIDATVALYHFLRYNTAYFDSYANLKKYGMSVRCLKDTITSQIKEINYDNRLQIYPNPAIDRITIDCAKKQVIKMQVYNMIGECVLQRELSSSANEINVSSLSKGVYIIKVSGTDWIVQKKMIKE